MIYFLYFILGFVHVLLMVMTYIFAKKMTIEENKYKDIKWTNGDRLLALLLCLFSPIGTVIALYEFLRTQGYFKKEAKW